MAFDPKTWFTQQIHPVYTDKGRNIGYFDTDANMCKGTIFLYTGEEAGDPSKWFVKNLLGVMTPVTTYCFSKGLTPVWATDAQKSANPAIYTPADPTPSPVITVSGVKIGVPMIAAIGVAVVGAVLILRR